MKKAVAAAFCCWALSATPGMAGPWIDDKGRSTEMMFADMTPISLAANGHTLSEGVDAFSQACMTTSFDKALAGAAVEKLGWGFRYQARMVPFKDPVDVGGWDAPDAALRTASAIFFNKRPQCNLTFVPAESVTLGQVQDAVSTKLGSQPSNVSKATDKNGKPKRGFEPQWSAIQPDGTTNIVFARFSPTVRGAVQLALLNKAPNK